MQKILWWRLNFIKKNKIFSILLLYKKNENQKSSQHRIPRRTLYAKDPLVEAQFNQICPSARGKSQLSYSPNTSTPPAFFRIA